jgi:ribonuclease BN (tRNA processing enzyme)
MKVTVLGVCGAWPVPGQACSGFLVEHDGFRLLLDVGYGTLTRLMQVTAVERLDAVLVSHGHPDHCADLNPLLRARALGPVHPTALPVHAMAGALDAVLALDPPGMLDSAYALEPFGAGDRFAIGPFAVATWPLPHFVPNAGLRLSAGGRTLAYTGDTGPSPSVADVANGADLFIAEATFAEQVPEASSRGLSSALYMGEMAARAQVRHLLLSHLWPGSDPVAMAQAARRAYSGRIDVAKGGDVFDLGS